MRGDSRMRILIVGGGEVGSSIAADLADAHEVVVVDRDRDRVDALSDALDVLAVHGDGTDLATLEEADVEAADVAIAATDDDETNLAVCGTVTAVSDTFTVCQVERTTYLRTWRQSRGAFGANLVVNSELRASRAITSIVELPMAHDVEEFGGGQVRSAEFEVTEESPVVGNAIDDLAGDELRTVGLIRDESVVVPDGATVEAGDHVVVIGTPVAVERFSERIVPPEASRDVTDVVVLGGTSAGHHVAGQLEERGWSPRLVVEDPERARELADDLTETTLLVHDPSDPDFLEREHVGDADVAVIALDSDQEGLLVSMLARRRGVDRTITVVESAEYDDLFEAAGVDVAVHPRAEAAEEISRFTRGRRAENVVIVEADVAEVFEVVVRSGSLLVGHTVSEVEADLPEGVTVGALVRDGDYLDPRPSVEVTEGDHVIVFAPADVSGEALQRL